MSDEPDAILDYWTNIPHTVKRITETGDLWIEPYTAITNSMDRTISITFRRAYPDTTIPYYATWLRPGEYCTTPTTFDHALPFRVEVKAVLTRDEIENQWSL